MRTGPSQSALWSSPRGSALPQSKLSEVDVEAIRSAAVQREKLRQYIRDNLSNEALARQFGVHVRTIEKALSYGSWRHVSGGHDLTTMRSDQRTIAA